MTPAQRIADGCAWSRAMLRRHRRYAVVNAANENAKPRPEPTEWR